MADIRVTSLDMSKDTNLDINVNDNTEIPNQKQDSTDPGLVNWLKTYFYLNEPTPPFITDLEDYSYYQAFKEKLYYLLGHTQDWFNNWLERNKLEKDFEKILKRNFEAEKIIITNVETNCKTWKQATVEKLKKRHVTEPKQAVKHALTKANIEQYKRRYANRKFITRFENEKFCELYPSASSINSGSVFDDCQEVLYSSNLKLEEAEFREKTWNQEMKNLQKKLDKDLLFIKNDLKSTKENLVLTEEKIVKKEQRINNLIKQHKDDKDILIKQHKDDKDILIKRQKEHKDVLIKESNHQKAHIQKLGKDVDRCKKTRESQTRKIALLEKLLKRDKFLGFLLEFIFEITVWPYAVYYEKSIFHDLLKKGNFRWGADHRLFATVAVSLVWVGLIINMVIPGLKPYINKWFVESEKTYEGDKDVEFDSISRKNPRPFLGRPRGGGQLLINAMDPIFIEIKAIKIKRELDVQFSKSSKRTIPSKIRMVSQKMARKQIILQMFLGILMFNGTIGEARLRRLSSSSIHQINSSTTINFSPIKLNTNKAVKIHLPNYNIILVKKPIKNSEESVEKIFKNRVFKKRKRVGRISDFSSKEFEQSGIKKTKMLPLNKVKITTNYEKKSSI